MGVVSANAKGGGEGPRLAFAYIVWEARLQSHQVGTFWVEPHEDDGSRCFVGMSLRSGWALRSIQTFVSGTQRGLVDLERRVQR